MKNAATGLKTVKKISTQEEGKYYVVLEGATEEEIAKIMKAVSMIMLCGQEDIAFEDLVPQKTATDMASEEVVQADEIATEQAEQVEQITEQTAEPNSYNDEAVNASDKANTADTADPAVSADTSSNQDPQNAPLSLKLWLQDAQSPRNDYAAEIKNLYFKLMSKEKSVDILKSLEETIINNDSRIVRTAGAIALCDILLREKNMEYSSQIFSICPQFAWRVVFNMKDEAPDSLAICQSFKANPEKCMNYAKRLCEKVEASCRKYVS